jgi:hypothetical protein
LKPLTYVDLPFIHHPDIKNTWIEFPAGIEQNGAKQAVP